MDPVTPSQALSAPQTSGDTKRCATNRWGLEGGIPYEAIRLHGCGYALAVWEEPDTEGEQLLYFDASNPAQPLRVCPGCSEALETGASPSRACSISDRELLTGEAASCWCR